MSTETPVQSENERLIGALDFLWLEITPKCNLGCIHCYAESAPFQPLTHGMKLENWKAVLEDAYSQGCKMLQFIGGEPTLYPHLLELVAHAKAIGYELIEIYTNGTLLNENMLETLRANDVHLAFSLYADCQDTHEQVTQRKGSFDKTVSAMRRSVELGFPVRVGIISMDANAERIDATKEFVRNIGITTVGIDRVRGIGRGVSMENGTDPFSELCGSCWKGKLCVESGGNVFPCVFSRFYPLGNVLGGGSLGTILKGKLLGSFRVKQFQEGRVAGHSATGCEPDCNPNNCRPALTNDCNPDCAPNCSPCVPDLRK